MVLSVLSEESKTLTHVVCECLVCRSCCVGCTNGLMSQKKLSKWKVLLGNWSKHGIFAEGKFTIRHFLDPVTLTCLHEYCGIYPKDPLLLSIEGLDAKT